MLLGGMIFEDKESQLSHQDEHFKAGLASLSVPSPHLPQSPLPPQLSLPVFICFSSFSSRVASAQGLDRHCSAPWGCLLGQARNITSPSPPESTFWLLPLAQRDLTFHFCLVLLFFQAFLHSDLSTVTLGITGDSNPNVRLVASKSAFPK